MRPKKLSDPEFAGWSHYYTSESGFWVYYAPDSPDAAMIDPKTNEVIFIIDRSRNEKIYQHPNMDRFTKKAFGRSLDITFRPETII